MEPLLHNIHLKFPTHGPWTHITPRFLLGNGWSYSLLTSVTFKDHCNKFPTQISSRNSQPFLQKLQLKSLSEHIKMAASLLPGMVQSSQVKSLAHLVFRLFGARTWCFCEIMMSFDGDTPQKLGIPCNFGRFCLVMCIPITKINVTIPVLLKILF